MTKQETLDSIKSLSTSWYRYTNLEYDSYGAWKKEVWVPESNLSYSEIYRDDGTLKCKGLTTGYSPIPVGTWWFCDSTGKVYKEYDYSTQRNIVYENKSEPMAWMFDSVCRTTRLEFEKRYGVDYAKRHIKISQYVKWYSHETGSEYTGNYPLMPRKNPYTYHVSANIMYDSIIVDRLTLTLDSSLTVVRPKDPRETPKKRKPFKLGFNQAALYASNAGYSTPRLFWSEDFHDFYWRSEKCEETTDPYDDENCHTFIRSATTGDPIPYFLVDRPTCRPSTQFKEYCRDTFVVPPGQKEIGFAGGSFAVPMPWLVTTSYNNYRRKSYMTNGHDTIFGISDCASWAYAYESRTVMDTASMNKFKSRFANGNIQGRYFDVKVVVRGVDLYDIRFTVIEPINALNCGQITSEYTAFGVNGQTRDLMLGIFATMHFLYCVPEKPVDK